MAALRDTARLFGAVVESPNLRRLELAWAASNLASRGSAVAVAVYAYGAAGPGAVGALLFARLLAAAACAPWLSVLADRYPRRLVLVGSELVRVLLLAGMAALALLDQAPYVVYTLAVAVAIAEPLFRSAQVALTPGLVVGAEQLTAANVLASAVESVGLFVGPALGGLVLAWSSPGAVFAASAVVLVPAVWLVWRIDVHEVVGGRDEKKARTSGPAELLAGFRRIGTDGGVRVVVGLFAAQTFVAGMFNVLVVVLALRLFDLGEAGVGWLDGAVGVGATVGIVAVAGVAGQRRLGPVFAVGNLLWGVPLALVAIRPNVAFAFLLMGLIGVGNTLVDVTGITLIQRATPDAVLARVFGAFEALSLLAMGLGSLAAPLAVAALGTRGAVLAAGLVLPAALLLLWRPLAAADARAAVPGDRVDALRASPIFGVLPAPELELLARAAVAEDYAPGAALVRAGDTADRVYVIVAGRVSVESDGRALRTLEPGDVFGEIAVLEDVPRTATVRALSPVRVLSVDGQTFVGALAVHPHAGEVAAGLVAARLATVRPTPAPV